VHHAFATDIRYRRRWVAARFSTGDVVQSVFEGSAARTRRFRRNDGGSVVGYLSTVVPPDPRRGAFHEAAQRDGRRAVSLEESNDGEGNELDPADAAISAEKTTRLLAIPRGVRAARATSAGARAWKGSLRSASSPRQLGYGSESAARRSVLDAQAKPRCSLGRRMTMSADPRRDSTSDAAVPSSSSR